MAFQSPGLGLTSGWAVGEDGWNPSYNADFLKLSVVAQCVAFSRVTAIPDTPTPGDVHLLIAEDSNSDFAVGSIIFFTGPTGTETWQSITPEEGWTAWVTGEGVEYRFIGGVWILQTAPELPTAEQVSYDPGDSNSVSGAATVQDALDYLMDNVGGGGGGPVDANDVTYNSEDGGDSNSDRTTVQGALDELYSRSRPYDVGFRIRAAQVNQTINFLVPRPFYIAVDFASCVAYAATTDGTARTFPIYKNGVQIGNVTFAISTATGTFSGDDSNSDAIISFAAGDRLGIGVPSALGTMEDVSITIAGNRVT